MASSHGRWATLAISEDPGWRLYRDWSFSPGDRSARTPGCRYQPGSPSGNCRHDCQHAVDPRRRISSRRGRVEENKCIRDLFRSIAPVINDPTLRVRLQELAATVTMTTSSRAHD